MSASGNPPEGGQYPPSGGYGQHPPPAGYPPGYDPGYGMPPSQPRNGLGTAALVLGVIGIVTCWTVVGGILLGVLAIVFGAIGRNRAKRGEATNGGVATGGLVTGIVGLVVGALILVLAVAGVVSFLRTPAGQQFQQCLQQAGNDQQAQQRCAQEFGRQIGGR